MKVACNFYASGLYLRVGSLYANIAAGIARGGRFYVFAFLEPGARRPQWAFCERCGVFAPRLEWDDAEQGYLYVLHDCCTGDGT